MSRKTRQRKEDRRVARIGSAPGSLHIDVDAPRPEVKVFAYGEGGFEEHEAKSVDEIRPFLGAWPVVWVNVDGMGDEATLRSLAELFGLHRLALEDVVNLGQRPKVEGYEDSLFVVARMPHADESSLSEQVSLFLGRNFVLTFQERRGDCFDGVRQRIRHGKGIVRQSGPDYLTYALLDAVVDAYFPVVEAMGETIERLDEEVLQQPEPSTVAGIHEAKHRLQQLRRTIGPHREVINALLRDAVEFVRPETAVYLRDCYDHVLRLTERVEVYREQCADLMNTYLTMVSNRMNEVMKVLTIIATIFIPLSFVAGLYGMNFNPQVSPWNMPELNWIWGYPFALGVMLLLAGGMLLYFKRRGWFD